MIGQMLNEMKVIERLDWFKEIYLKFRQIWSRTQEGKGIQSEERRKVKDLAMCWDKIHTCYC